VTVTAPDRTLDELSMLGKFGLDELVERQALEEMTQAFFELYRLPLRVFDADGVLLAETKEPVAVYDYLNRFKPARVQIQEVVARVKRIDLGGSGEASVPCITGGRYQVLGIEYDHRHLGRMVLGPFLPASLTEVPGALLELDPAIDASQLKSLLPRMPRAKEEAVQRIGRHLRSIVDLCLFSGHKALLASSMHLASVRESYRDLQAKNAQLQEAYDRLKELDRLKSNFLATVSHELRTPLTSIIGYSEMLAEGIAGPMSPDQVDFVRTIHEKGEQLLELITGLLDLSKLESGTLAIKRRQVDVGALIEDVADTLAPTAHKRGVGLERRVQVGLPDLFADPARLRQVLLNLTENALKFTPPGGTVTLSAHTTSLTPAREEEDGGGLVLLATKLPAVALVVTDTGIGITDEEKTRVFDPFYQVDSSSTRSVGGTGLGLSIVKRLVDAHSGSVRIEDNLPSGASFIVTIPQRRATLS
jgi:two-component system, NarL family, sensor histidine kinase BarA